MNEIDLLQAVRAAPTDDGIRLAYADWLEEQGDRRAPYLRLTVEIAAAIREGRDWYDEEVTIRELAKAIPGEWRRAIGIPCDLILEFHDPFHDLTYDLSRGLPRGRRHIAADLFGAEDELYPDIPFVLRAGVSLDEAIDVRNSAEVVASLHAGMLSQPRGVLTIRLARNEGEQDHGSQRLSESDRDL